MHSQQQNFEQKQYERNGGENSEKGRPRAVHLTDLSATVLIRSFPLKRQQSFFLKKKKKKV